MGFILPPSFLGLSLEVWVIVNCRYLSLLARAVSSRSVKGIRPPRRKEWRLRRRVSVCASRAPHLTVHFTAHFTASLSRIRLIDYLPRFLQASTGVLPRLIFLPPTEFAKGP